jgi:hypothetical protein
LPLELRFGSGCAPPRSSWTLFCSEASPRSRAGKPTLALDSLCPIRPRLPTSRRRLCLFRLCSHCPSRFYSLRLKYSPVSLDACTTCIDPPDPPVDPQAPAELLRIVHLAPNRRPAQAPPPPHRRSHASGRQAKRVHIAAALAVQRFQWLQRPLADPRKGPQRPPPGRPTPDQAEQRHEHARPVQGPPENVVRPRPRGGGAHPDPGPDGPWLPQLGKGPRARERLRARRAQCGRLPQRRARRQVGRRRGAAVRRGRFAPAAERAARRPPDGHPENLHVARGPDARAGREQGRDDVLDTAAKVPRTPGEGRMVAGAGRSADGIDAIATGPGARASARRVCLRPLKDYH